LVVSHGPCTMYARLDLTAGTLTPVSVCSGAPSLDVCLRPAMPRVLGSSCTSPPCAPCTTTALLSSGPPTIGNPGFGVRVVNAPAGAAAWAALGLGPCRSAGIPLWCGLIHVDVGGPVGVFGPMLMTGAAPCSGAGFFHVPIPLDPGLCGLMVSCQGILTCPGTPLGVGLTNCLGFVLSGY
jgi:hypothetical protein